jgi:hypothetical protein
MVGMPEQPLETFRQQDKVHILLQEYNSLRTEVIHRANNLYQLLAIGGAVFLWALTRLLEPSVRIIDARFWWSLAVPVAVVSLLLCYLNRDILKAAARLRELESDINRRAGETLLEWETRWGGAVTGFWGRARPLRPQRKSG